MKSSIQFRPGNRRGMKLLLSIARTEVGFTQVELAQLLDCSRSTLSMVERGQRRLPTGAALKLIELMETLAPVRHQRSSKTRGPEMAADTRKRLLKNMEARLKALRHERDELQRALHKFEETLQHAREKRWLFNCLECKKDDKATANRQAQKRHVVVRMHVQRYAASIAKCDPQQKIELELGLAAVHGKIKFLRKELKSLRHR